MLKIIILRHSFLICIHKLNKNYKQTKHYEKYVTIDLATIDGKLNIRIVNGIDILYNSDEGGKPDPVSLIVEGYDGLEMDLWDSSKFDNGPGYDIADNDISASDWISTPNVISVGSYCTNTTSRKYPTNGSTRRNLLVTTDGVLGTSFEGVRSILSTVRL